VNGEEVTTAQLTQSSVREAEIAPRNFRTVLVSKDLQANRKV